ncbi:hypothetical protein [Bosea robiniae]|uniref:Transcriptional regulator n=1 Tax=Bosea robiniae TaxID=1036780 RepID=A0ABY0P419_9HYPH|nr:hypothetical protein [Bosea robiniae]SDH20249.1 hypothetical protein SAMN05421844_107147 [Bosea robiniae]
MCALTEVQVRETLRLAVAESGIADWSARHAVSRTYVQDVLAGRRAPGRSILAGLGLTKRTVFQRVGDATHDM